MTALGEVCPEFAGSALRGRNRRRFRPENARLRLPGRKKPTDAAKRGSFRSQSQKNSPNQRFPSSPDIYRTDNEQCTKRLGSHSAPSRNRPLPVGHGFSLLRVQHRFPQNGVHAGLIAFAANLELGRVLIGFDPEADAGEGDCGEEVSCELVIAGRDASEVLELLKKRSTRLRWR